MPYLGVNITFWGASNLLKNFFEKMPLRSDPIQVIYHYDDKNNQCLPKLTNIHSSYRYNYKQTDTLTSYHMSAIFTECTLGIH